MKYIIIFIYLAVNVLLFIFNIDLFTTFLDFDLGFGIISTLPLVILQVFGFIILGVYMIWDKMKDLKREVLITKLQKQIIELQKNAEIQQLKNEAKNIVKADEKINILAAEF
ncbi:hypothetical protein [Polaribacter glomeratus]|uniref:Lipopolysaccharide assembly protein A domain-containing protein n=1 Tax=Polaribacter glomeratus TaxID=102 RepID=A0A2S7WI23_9FLAO|nr:hypothetical protein [Polaribacter glomeratus]PQJ77259.1 hypothetical protein BTO16_15595 [Polaribacter glomeratus]TXD65093.1 hypothetical protein ESX12_11485 [Polaribacter glomeratus]